MTMKAQSRSESGKGIASSIRNEGMIPAVVYGAGKKATPISLDSHDLMMDMKKGNFFSTVQSVEIDGKEEQVLVRDLQRHPVSDKVIHADFLRFKANKAVKVKTPLILLNAENSAGVKLGGIAQVVISSLEVSCLAKNIPTGIEIDIAHLKVGDSVKLDEITLPENVQAIAKQNLTLASVVPTRQTALAQQDGDEDGEEAVAAEAEAPAAE
ncbi:MAG: 50S ribosomal protein L25/general stress protein Ctc [Proteobacteria bacterium]|nr:50S ribosomal protein L25/general stress protein Ctc [Pseudomonadota bacterium]